MIQNWYYVTLPTDEQGNVAIDMSADLMPLRDPDDPHRYGIDFAWQYETLAVWYATVRGTSPAVTMDIHPKAANMNARNALARNCRTKNTSATGTVLNTLMTAAPTQRFAASGEPTNLKRSFPAVQSDVNVGQNVARSHIADMFNFMRYVKLGCRGESYTIPTISGWTQEGADEDWGGTVASPGSNELYRWNWFYEYYVNPGPWSITGGYWRRWTAPSTALSCTMSGLKAEWFSGASVFVRVDVYTGRYHGDVQGTYFGTAWSPCGAATLTQSGMSLIVSTTVDGSAGLAARRVLGVGETAYKDDMDVDADGNKYGGDLISTRLQGNAYVFLQFADDYVYPEAQA